MASATFEGERTGILLQGHLLMTNALGLEKVGFLARKEVGVGRDSALPLTTVASHVDTVCEKLI